MLPQFLLLSAISLLTSAATATATAESFTIYEVLSSHGLPIGLIPTGVNDFKYDQSGQFEFHLDRECNVKFDSELHYDRNVSGNLFYGQIAGLSGISAQDLFLWFPVKGIRVDVPSSGLIYFDVGVVSKQFSLALFETPRDCVAAETPDRVSKSVDMASFHINWIMVIFRVLFGRSGR